MLKLSYNLSPVLKDSLRKAEVLRQRILLTPLSPTNELRLRWEAKIERIYWSLALSNSPFSKHQAVKIVLKDAGKRLDEKETEVIRYKKGLDYINQYWIANEDNLTPKVILKLHGIVSPGSFKSSENELKQILDYIQSEKESPIIQAAIAQLELQAGDFFTDGNGRCSRLLSHLILCKHGYDFRGLLVLEEYWRKDLSAFKEISQEAIKTNSLTLWLIYYAKAVTTQLEKIVQDLNYPNSNLDLPQEFWQLNQRQREILTLLEEPKKVMTNKEVQKIFKISQITASRDLSKLATLGLLFSHGKGRSVRYTRI